MTTRRFVASSFSIALLLGCVGPRPDHLGVANGRLAPCPASPNCVSSDATDAVHAIAPLTPIGDPSIAWRAVGDAVEATERTVIVSQRAGYLHAESTSALMRYVDDLELQLRAAEGIIAVRSASRVGYGDMGANRARVEALRARLAAQGVVAAD
jgi:uncharacterized protein (DUF1499 family)